MKRFIKIVGIVFLVIIVVVVGALIYFNSAYPKAGPPPEIKVEITQARLETGRYYSEHVAACIHCHSSRNWSLYSGPVIRGTEGMGGQRFAKEAGVPGIVYSKNITPANLKDWSDGEIMHAIVSGVNKKGQALFPLMPYPEYSKMSREDLYSIIAYIRSIPPIQNDVPETDLDFPVSMIIKTLPRPAAISDGPNKNDSVNYGHYLISTAACTHCHTPSKDGKPVMELLFAGGAEFSLPWGTVRSVNITPDDQTGIGSWTKDIFISRFKVFESDSARNTPVKSNEFNTIMPWTDYAGMTPEDLGAIYNYLRTIKPVNHNVMRFTPR